MSPWESVIEEGVEFVSKSNPTRIVLPAVVFAGKERDKVFVAADEDLAATCTKAIGLDALFTVKLIAALVVVLPDVSDATAVSVCAALVRDVVIRE